LVVRNGCYGFGFGLLGGLEEFEGAGHGGGLVLGFLEFGFGVGIGDDAGAGADGEASVFGDGGADADAEVHVAVEGDVADGAAVGAARFVFEVGDDLHGADLGGAGEGAGGEGGGEEVEGIVAGFEVGGDVGDEVHDVGVALDDHEVGDLDGAGEGDAAEFVAAEVDEHEMLGAFLFVLEEAVGQLAVLLFGGAAGAGAGDGAEGGGAVVEADHGFGGGADEGAAGSLEEEEVGGGVDVALGAVEADEVVGGGADEGLGDDALDDVALVDVVLDLGDHALEVLGGMDGQGLADGGLAGGGARGDGFGQRGEEILHAGGGGIEERVGFAVLLEGEGEGGEGVVDVVEDEEGVGDDELGHGALGRELVGHARLEEVDHLVGEIADEAAAEAGQAGEVREGIGLHEGAQDGQGVALVGDALFVDALADDDIVAEDGDAGAGGDAHEGIAAPAFAALGAFEEEEVGVVGGETGEDGDGRFGVGQDAGADGDDGGGAQQGAELRAGGEGLEQHVFSLVHEIFAPCFCI
jgi:hypothetical protein